MSGDRAPKEDLAYLRPHPLDRMASEPEPAEVSGSRAILFLALTTAIGASAAPLTVMALLTVVSGAVPDLRSGTWGPVLPVAISLGAVHGLGLGIGSVTAVDRARRRHGSERAAIVLGGLLGYLTVAVLTVASGGLPLAYAVAEAAAVPALCLGLAVITALGRRILLPR